MVLPISVAPSFSSTSTAGAVVCATGCVLFQRGFPAAVTNPSTSKSSFTAKVSDESSPSRLGVTVIISPGTKALQVSTGFIGRLAGGGLSKFYLCRSSGNQTVHPANLPIIQRADHLSHKL